MDVVSSTGFNVKTIHLNPGNKALMVWASALAHMFEKYTLDELQIEYEPKCPTSSQGMIMAAIDHDVDDTPPANKQDLYQHVGARSGPAWAPYAIRVNPQDLKKRGELFVNSTGHATDKFHDFGNLFIATDGFASDASVVGEIYVSYVLSLRVPQPSEKVVSEHAITGTITTMGTTGTVDTYDSGAVSYGRAIGYTPTAGTTPPFGVISVENVYYLTIPWNVDYSARITIVDTADSAIWDGLHSPTAHVLLH
jgi:hypothetical protein